MPTSPPVTDPNVFLVSCNVCGHPFLCHRLGERGRPREFCSPECKMVATSWDAFETAFQKIVEKVTIRQLFEWRGLLLGLASSRAWNKGLPGVTRKGQRTEALHAEVLAIQAERERILVEERDRYTQSRERIGVEERNRYERMRVTTATSPPMTAPTVGEESGTTNPAAPPIMAPIMAVPIQPAP